MCVCVCVVAKQMEDPILLRSNYRAIVVGMAGGRLGRWGNTKDNAIFYTRHEVGCKLRYVRRGLQKG